MDSGDEPEDETLPERGPNLFSQLVHACLEKLALKASGPQASRLREEAIACQREIDAWERTRPTDDERTAMRARLRELGDRIARL